MNQKSCIGCSTTKDITGFGIDKSKPDGFNSYCKECIAKRNKDRRKADPRKQEDCRLRKAYGITLEEYEQMVEDRNGLCDGCKEAPASGYNKGLYVDHCHETGKVRGILCQQCNTALGMVRDRVETLHNLIAYLRGS